MDVEALVYCTSLPHPSLGPSFATVPLILPCNRLPQLMLILDFLCKTTPTGLLSYQLGVIRYCCPEETESFKGEQPLIVLACERV
jgi:hypothetical protein